MRTVDPRASAQVVQTYTRIRNIRRNKDARARKDRYRRSLIARDMRTAEFEVIFQRKTIKSDVFVIAALYSFFLSFAFLYGKSARNTFARL